MSDDSELITIADAETLVASAFEAVGVAPGIAASVARALVAAEAEGQVGHGFTRVADYAAQVRSGKVDGRAAPVLTARAPAALEVDAADGFAYPALEAAISWGIDAARAQGAASMAVHRSHHCGALSVQVAKLAEAGLVGLMLANSPPAIAPWGARTPFFGTNPIAFAAPRAGADPLVIDLSLSRVARGKVMAAKKAGKPIPEGWALDAEGRPTTDPEAALAGSMVPIGEAKGTALALMVEVLAATLTGAHHSAEVSSFFDADGPPCGAGQFLLALDPGDRPGFVARLERLLGSIEAMEGARVPGTRRARVLAKAKAEGLSVPRRMLDAIREMAAGHA